MRYRALVSFTGLVSMAKGQVREISDLSLAHDLLKAKYIEEVKADEKGTNVPEQKTVPKTSKKAKTPKKKESKK